MSAEPTNEPSGVHLVAYADGSCRGNPGFAAAGLFVYILGPSKKPKNIKHPIHDKLYFTSKGILSEKDEAPFEVLQIVEVIKAINCPTSTNNEAELLGVLEALKIASNTESLKTITIFTDSNYIVTAFNESLDKWKRNGWRRLDGKPIVHLTEWLMIHDYREQFHQAGVEFHLNWIKGHGDNYGNNTADLLSVIGSNAARDQITHQKPFNEYILNHTWTYPEFKKSFIDKDFVFFFRDLYFSSNTIDDTNYCFIGSSDNPNQTGKRDMSSIFITNIGYVPPIINQLKQRFRALPREYTVTCCIKLNKFDHKELFRLAHLVDIDYLMIPTISKDRIYYTLVKDTTPFIFENTVEYPFIIHATKLFGRMSDVNAEKDIPNHPTLFKIDVTERFVRDQKLVINNKDKSIDFSDLVQDLVTLKQKLIIKLGYDIPSHLALKNIESQIRKVELILQKNEHDNFCTVYMHFITEDREIYTVNITNKYLIVSR